jgi:hypothetical protein
MSFPTHLPLLVVAGAVATSTACVDTSLWFLDASEPLGSTVIDDSKPTNVRAIQAVVNSGDDPPDAPAGSMIVNVTLSAPIVTGAPLAVIDIDLRSNARLHESDRRIVTIPPTGMKGIQLELPAWTECASRTCTEDYTLTLRRVPADGDPLINLSGNILARFRAEGPDYEGDDTIEPPSGASLEVDVMDLGSAPVTFAERSGSADPARARARGSRRTASRTTRP